MDTEHLIRTLAADAGPPQRPVGEVLALALLLAAPISIALFMSLLGLRPDVRTAMHNPFFDLKFVVTVALAATAIIVSLHIARPEASLRGWAWLLLIPAGACAQGPFARLVNLIGGNPVPAGPQPLPMTPPRQQGFTVTDQPRSSEIAVELGQERAHRFERAREIYRAHRLAQRTKGVEIG